MIYSRPLFFLFIIFDELYEFIDFFFACIPGRTGRLLRMLYFSILFRKLVTANIGQNVRIRGIKGIVLGNRVMIGDNNFITAKSSGSIVIGDNVSLNMSCHVNADVNGSIILEMILSMGLHVYFVPLIINSAPVSPPSILTMVL